MDFLSPASMLFWSRSAAGIPDDELEGKKNLLWSAMRMAYPILHGAHGRSAYRLAGLMDRGQRHCQQRRVSHIIEADHADVLRQADTQAGESLNQLSRSLVI